MVYVVLFEYPTLKCRFFLYSTLYKVMYVATLTDNQISWSSMGITHLTLNASHPSVVTK